MKGGSRKVYVTAPAAGSGMKLLVGRKTASLSAGGRSGSRSGAAFAGDRRASADTPVLVEWVAEDEQQFKAGRVLLRAGRCAEAALIFVDSAHVAIGDERAAAYTPAVEEARPWLESAKLF